MKPESSLWKEMEFVQIWTSFSFSEFSSNILITIFPLVAASVIHASPFQMGLLATASTLPYIVFGPFVGPLADRLPRRAILIWSDVARTLILLFGIACAALHSLGFAVLYFVAFGVGVGNVWYDIAIGSYLPFVVDRKRLIMANSYLSTSQSVASTTGPGIAGIVLATVGAVLGISISAVLYALSALLLYMSNKGNTANTSDRLKQSSVFSDMKDGVVFIWEHPLLRMLTKRHIVWHFIVGGIYSQLVLHLVGDLKLAAASAGVLLSSIGVGTVVAAVYAGRLSSRIGVGRAIAWSNFAAALFTPLIALASGDSILATAAVGSALFVYGFAFITYQINNASLRQVVTTDSMLGRMTAAVRVSTFGANAVGAICAGFLAQQFSVRSAIAGYAALAICTSLRGVLSKPLLSIQTLPEPGEEPIIEPAQANNAGSAVADAN